MALDVRPRLARGLVLERLPALDTLAPLDAAERLRGLPGRVLLESARPGRLARWSYLAADPLDTIGPPDDGSDPFADARRLLRRLTPRPIAGDAPAWTGGLAGYLSYDLGRRLERLPSRAAIDQPLPDLRFGLYDLVIAWDRRLGAAWLVGRAVDGDLDRLRHRRERLLVRLLASAPGSEPSGAPAPGSDGQDVGGPASAIPTTFVSDLDRPSFEAMVERVRQEIARGEIYQANLTRRLEAPFAGDPWPVFRRLRTGDPALFAGYLDLGPSPARGAPRALLSASPEPFLAVDADGNVATDPIKGTRQRGRTRAEDRSLARELLASGKDRAENVMIVDVLRNDLGRVCVPGSVRVPRLLRLERTAAVQHLVTTVTGRLRPDADAFDLLAASFPGGSITGAPKIRAMEIIEGLEPVRRGPYCGTMLWLGPDGCLGSSILIRTFVADGERMTLHVGGGITSRSDPQEEWDETIAKARGPLSSIDAVEVPS